MKIALLGYGRMGKMVERMAVQHGVEVVERYWDEHLFNADASTREKLKGVQVLIDFSIPGAVIENVQHCAALQKNVVVGTRVGLIT